MNLSRRQFMYLAAAGAALPAVARSAWAQSWPNHVIRLVVGFPPGGLADAAARIAANRLSELWGQQVVVENRGGAGGNIAHDTVAHAAPDGYSILFSPGSLPIMPQLFPGLSFDPMTDFMPISTLGRYPNLVVVSRTTSTRPGPTQARSPLRRQGSAPRPILPPSCSRIWLVSTSRTCPIAGSRRVR